MKKSSTVLILVLMVTASVLAAEITTADKSEFIIELIENIEWSKGKGPANGGPVRVGIINDVALANTLTEKAATSSNKFEAVSLTASDDLTGFHIVFTSSQELKHLAGFLKQVGNKSICTVSNAKDFARYGIMVNFYAPDGKKDITFEVNQMVLDGAGIKLTSGFSKKAVKI